MVKAVVVAGTGSGVGKTTVSLALMSALMLRGLRVQAFKVGPDFIDPGHHGVVTGRDSHNLDGWMLSREENRAIFDRYVADADVAVVEGVMGLFDGYDGSSEAGSTAQMAKWLGLPVILVTNARAMARSLGAVALGFARFDPEVRFVGLLANNVGSPTHLEYLSQAMEVVPQMPFLGGLRRDDGIMMGERHLGLVTAEEQCLSAETLARLASWIEGAIALDDSLAAVPEIDVTAPQHRLFPAEDRVRVGVARDKSFCFYYPENLRRLAEAGAELVFFSPLSDDGPPDGLGGLYLGGGYPELFAGVLSENEAMRRRILEAAGSGMPIYGECGGMMYLGEELRDLDGRKWPMVGFLPIETRMLDRLRSLGYRRVTLAGDTILGRPGLSARGHEFHYSEITRVNSGADFSDGAYEVENRTGRSEKVRGFSLGNTLASYLHLHFGSQPRIAPNFVAACRAWKEGRS